MARQVMGLDACKGGWVACVWDGHARPRFATFPDIATAHRANPGVSQTLMDVPIGLPQRGVRDCDMRAKRILGAVQLAGFLTPPREVFDVGTYEEANPLCRLLSDRGLMKQMWAIMPGIRRTDISLREAGVIRSVVRECHPEICFWGLSGAVIGENKKTDEGAAARLGVLSAFVDDVAGVIADALSRWPRKVLARDDVIDALVCAVTAAGVWDGSLRTLPEQPERDAYGLAMEMVYRDGQAMVRK